MAYGLHPSRRYAMLPLPKNSRGLALFPFFPHVSFLDCSSEPRPLKFPTPKIQKPGP